MTKAPTPTEMSKEQSDNTNNDIKKFDETAIAESRLTIREDKDQDPVDSEEVWTRPVI